MVPPVSTLPLGRTIEFRVAGAAVPQGSMRAYRAGRFTNVVPDNQRELTRWRDRIAQEAQTVQGDGILSDVIPFGKGVPVRVDLRFRLAPIASAPKRRRIWPVGRKDDIDKLTRAVLDGITHVLIYDDGQVVRLTVEKDYAGAGGWGRGLGSWEGVLVRITEVND